MRTRTSLKIMTGSPTLVPLVSLFFILLVFFMISNSLVFWPGTKVETSLRLPKARMSSMSEADKIVITVTRSGQLFFNDRNVAWADLEQKLAQMVSDMRKAAASRAGLTAGAAENVRQPMLVLRADKDITYAQFFDIMTLGRSLGLDVWLVSDSSETGGEAPGAVLGGDLD